MSKTSEVDPARLRILGQLDTIAWQLSTLLARQSELQSALKDIETARELEERADPLEADLEALDWKRATSGKCDYVRNAPLGLVQRVRDRRGGVRGTKHRYTAHATDDVLFRHERTK